MRRFTSFGGSSSSGTKKKKSEKLRDSSRPHSLVYDGEGALDAGAMNELEMLRAENAHLKRLIAEQQHDEDGGGGGGGGASSAEVAHLRRERDELQRQLATLRADYEDLQREYANLQRDRRMEVEALHSKTKTVEAQIEFMGQQHQQELDEKENRIQELEMKLVDLEQEVELAQSPLAAPYAQARSLDMDEMRERVADLEKRLQVAKVDNQRRAEEADRLREELQDLKARGTDEGTVAAIKAERDYLRAQVEECAAKAKNYQIKAEELEEEVERLCDETHKKMQLVNRLEAQISDLRLQAEMAKAGESGGAGPGDGSRADAAPSDVGELQRLLKEKEKSVWDLSDRLLQISTEKDKLEQTIRQLKLGQVEGGSSSATAASGQPLTPSSSSKKKGKTALTEDNLQLQQQVSQLQSQVSQAREEAEQKIRGYEKRIADLEKQTLDLEAEERRVTGELRKLESERDRLENLIKKKDAEIAALEVSKEYQVQALSVARNVILPVTHRKPGGAKGRGASSLDSTEASSSSTEEEEGDLQVALALKTAALRALSVKNAHLNDVLQRLRVATSTQQTEKELEDLSQKLEEARKELRDSQEDVRTLKTEKSKLQAQVSRLETELDLAQRTLTSTREALQEAQTRNVTTADRYKAQSEKYSTMLSDAMREVDRLQDEVSKERSARLEASNRYREQVRALRASKARRLDLENEDPLKPARLQHPFARSISSEEDLIPKETEGSSGPAAGSVGMVLQEKTMEASARSRPMPLEKSCLEENVGDKEGKLPVTVAAKDDDIVTATPKPQSDWEKPEHSKLSADLTGEPYPEVVSTYVLSPYEMSDGLILGSPGDGHTLYSSPAYYYNTSEVVSYSTAGPTSYAYPAIDAFTVMQRQSNSSGGGGGGGPGEGGLSRLTVYQRSDLGRGRGMYDYYEYIGEEADNRGMAREESCQSYNYYSVLGKDGVVRCVRAEDSKNRGSKTPEPTPQEKHVAAEILRKYVEEEELKRERRARRKREALEEGKSRQQSELQSRGHVESQDSLPTADSRRQQGEGPDRSQEGRSLTRSQRAERKGVGPASRPGPDVMAEDQRQPFYGSSDVLASEGVSGAANECRGGDHQQGTDTLAKKAAEQCGSLVVYPSSSGQTGVYTPRHHAACSPRQASSGSPGSTEGAGEQAAGSGRRVSPGPVNAIQKLFSSNSPRRKGSSGVVSFDSAVCGVEPPGGSAEFDYSSYKSDLSSVARAPSGTSEKGGGGGGGGGGRAKASLSSHIPSGKGAGPSTCGVVTSTGANLQSSHTLSSAPRSHGTLTSVGSTVTTARSLGEQNAGGGGTRIASPWETRPTGEENPPQVNGSVGEGRAGTRLRSLTRAFLSDALLDGVQTDRGKGTSPGTSRGRQPERQTSSPRETPQKGESSESVDLSHVLGRLESVNRKGRAFFGEKGTAEDGDHAMGAAEGAGAEDTCASEDVDLS